MHRRWGGGGRRTAGHGCRGRENRHRKVERKGTSTAVRGSLQPDTGACPCTHVHTPARMHVYAHQHTRACTHTCTCVHSCTPPTSPHTHLHTPAGKCTAHTRTLTHTPAGMHTRSHLCVHTHTCINMHVCLHTCSQQPPRSHEREESLDVTQVGRSGDLQDMEPREQLQAEAEDKDPSPRELQSKCD